MADPKDRPRPQHRGIGKSFTSLYVGLAMGLLGGLAVALWLRRAPNRGSSFGKSLSPRLAQSVCLGWRSG